MINSKLVILIIFISQLVIGCNSNIETNKNSVILKNLNSANEILFEKTNPINTEIETEIVCNEIDIRSIKETRNFHYDSIEYYINNKLDFDIVKSLTIVGLDTIPDRLSQFKNLETLILDRSKEFRYGLYKLKNIKNIIVIGEISISKDDKGWELIEVLDVSHSQISGFNNIAFMKNLKKIKILDSSIDEFPENIDNLDQLQFLQFSNVFYKNINTNKFNMKNINLVNHPCLKTLNINDTRDILYNIPLNFNAHRFKTLSYYDKSLTENQRKIVVSKVR